MTFLKDDIYTDNANKFFEWFQYNFKTDKEGSHPTHYKYYLKDIPNTYFKAVDVHYDDNKFLRRYLIVAVQNGDTSRISPESYQEYLQHLCDLPNPVGTSYPRELH